MDNYEISPWFSWEEWEDVYHNVFGNKAEDWKKAYEQISVWKSRVSTLAVGLEGTLPLLQAQLAWADPALEESYKISILNMSILRFVSTVTKGFQERYLPGKPMLDLAPRMNLPPYLVNLRNHIIHSDHPMGQSHTIEVALESSMQWIKFYYWEMEEEKRQNVSKASATTDVLPKRVQADPCDVADSAKRDPLSKFFRKEIAQYVNLASRRKIPHDQILMKQSQIEDKMRVLASPKGSEYMKVIVANLFYRFRFQIIYKQNREIKAHICPECNCVISNTFVQLVSFAVRRAVQLNVSEQMIAELIAQGEECPGLCSDWLTIFHNTWHKLCTKHSFAISKNGRTDFVDWKFISYLLLDTGHKWSLSIALRILKRRENAEFSHKSVDALEELSEIYCPSANPAENFDAPSGSPAVVLPTKVHTLNEVLQEVKKKRPKDFNFGEDVCPPLANAKRAKKSERLRTNETILGILPNQKDDPLFYLQLILDSPSKSAKIKRKRKSPPA